MLNKNGKKLSRVIVFKIRKRLTDVDGIKTNVSPHTLRQSFATHLVEGGADVRAEHEMLGHQSYNNTEIYTPLDKNYHRHIILAHHSLEKTKLHW